MRCATWLCVSVMRCVGILDCPICMGETMILACLCARYAHDSSGHLYHWCARCMRFHSSTTIPSLCVCLVGFRIWFLSQHTSNMPCEWQATSSGSKHTRHHQTNKKKLSLFFPPKERNATRLSQSVNARTLLAPALCVYDWSSNGAQVIVMTAYTVSIDSVYEPNSTSVIQNTLNKVDLFQYSV